MTELLGWIAALIRRIQMCATGEISGFDPYFYSKCYGDLYRLESSRALRKHYLNHGRAEGRWKSFADAINNLESRFGVLPRDFNPRVYKLLNDDLVRVFVHDFQFTFHFLMRGRSEGRKYKQDRRDAPSPEKLWMYLFRLGDFVAMAETWLETTPQTYAQGMRIFLDEGIRRLAPFNLGYIFDPSFYRSAYGFDRSLGDETLYRDWLENGIIIGRFPNEECALFELIGERSYPQCFDYAGYKAYLPSRESRRLPHRIDVLKHFLDRGFAKDAAVSIVGPGAGEFFASIGYYHYIRGHHFLAIDAYNRAVAFGNNSSSVFHHRGEARGALGDADGALGDFLQASTIPNASVRSTLRAASFAAQKGCFAQAFDLLAEARDKCGTYSEYRKSVDETLNRYFAASSRSAMSLYEVADRAAADKLLFETAAEICRRITALEEMPSRIAPAFAGHISILADQSLAQCRHYRVEQKLRQMQHAGLKAKVFCLDDADLFISSLLGAEAAIFYRVPAFPNVIRAILVAKALGITTYYELDDLIFDSAHYPGPFATYGNMISKAQYTDLLYGVPLYRYAMGLCDEGIASTTPLARYIKPFVKSHNCIVVRNGLDERNKEGVAIGAMPRPERDILSIFYGSGTKAHNSDFDLLAAPALRSILEQFPNVRLVIVGHLRLHPELEQYSARIKRFQFIDDINQYWSILAASDINLAVLSPGIMASCKSEIKWLEAAILQVPSIVSKTETYNEILEDGIDALLVNDDPGAWLQALKRLIEDRDLRRSIGAAARDKALRDYSIQSAATALRKVFNPVRIASKDQDSEVSKIKVLICHVFFPPQAYGGATRVVQENVDYIMRECQDIELSVFTTDDGVSPGSRLRFDQYKGTPVFRMSTPLEPDMDWRPFNADHEDIFEQLVDRIQPNLIHFHCVQHLTASIVEVALRKEISYFITAHDGWWISDHQFFVDADDVLRLPSCDRFVDVPPASVNLAESISRRERLARLLDGAVQIIAPSNSFADIYREAGCQRVVTLSNGISPIARKKTMRTGRDSGRLSLGHIGGRSAHKGATLVESVLRKTHFDHLLLTMIDFKMEPGTSLETIWGNTPVLICGGYAQQHMAELYATFDVLLAPSIWPESFGLATREAQALGLWVIASDRGAIADSLHQGEDGFAIDVSNGRALTETLKKLDSDVCRYRDPPPVSAQPAHSASDQGRDLAEMYRAAASGLRQGIGQEEIGS